MPYTIEQRESQYCVVKEDDGTVMGCHDTREEAEDQIAAIEANEGKGYAWFRLSEDGARWLRIHKEANDLLRRLEYDALMARLRGGFDEDTQV